MGPCGDALARCGPWVILPVGVVRSGGPEGPDAVRGDTGEGASRGAAAAGLGWTRIRAETEWADGRVGRLVLLVLRRCHFFSVPAAGSASCCCPSVLDLSSDPPPPARVHTHTHSVALPIVWAPASSGPLSPPEPRVRESVCSCFVASPGCLNVSELALISAALPSETDCDIVRPSTNGQEENICMSTVGPSQIPV